MDYPFIEEFCTSKVVYVVTRLEKDGSFQSWGFLDSDLNWDKDITRPGVICETPREAENMKKCWDLRETGVECEIRKVVRKIASMKYL